MSLEETNTRLWVWRVLFTLPKQCSGMPTRIGRPRYWYPRLVFDNVNLGCHQYGSRFDVTTLFQANMDLCWWKTKFRPIIRLSPAYAIGMPGLFCCSLGPGTATRNIATSRFKASPTKWTSTRANGRRTWVIFLRSNSIRHVWPKRCRSPSSLGQTLIA